MQTSPTTTSGEVPPTPLRCLTGAAISAPITAAAYFLTTSIHQTFAAKPLVSDNMLALRLSALVRTLVLGVSTLATITFAIATLGLIGLAIQLMVQSGRNSSTPTPPES
ncbi:DUF3082 domain-containing protein [Leptolyngbya sp. AN02str]